MIRAHKSVVESISTIDSARPRVRSHVHRRSRDSVLSPVDPGNVLNQGAVYDGSSLNPTIAAVETTHAQLAGMVARVGATPLAFGKILHAEEVSAVLDLGQQYVGALKALQSAVADSGLEAQGDDPDEAAERTQEAMRNNGSSESGQQMKTGDARHPMLAPRRAPPSAAAIARGQQAAAQAAAVTKVNDDWNARARGVWAERTSALLDSMGFRRK